MQVEKIELEDTGKAGLRQEYNIVIPANDITKKINKRLKEIGKDLKMDGFRPGKVPPHIVKKNYGSGVVGEILEQVVQQSSVKALSEKDIRPAMQPKIEILKFEEGSDLEYKMEFEILPEVPEIDFSSITIERPKAEIGEKEVNEALVLIAEGSKEFKPTNEGRVAKKGDAVKIDFKGFIDGKVFEGGEAKDHILELGSNSFIEGFEEQLEGTTSGSEKDVNVTFPDTYHSDELAGKDAKFEVKVHEVLEAKEQEIDDSLAEKLGFENIEKLKEVVKEQVENDVAGACRSIAKKELFDALDKKYVFAVPEEMESLEFDSIWKQVQEAKKSNANSEDFNKSDEELEKEYREIASRRVRLGILLSDFGAKKSITIEQNDLNSAILDEAKMFPGQEQKVFEHYQNNPEQLEALKGPILEEKVVDLILESVTIKDNVMSLSELQEFNKKLR